MKAKLSLAITGFTQVYFVANSTYFIANKIYIGAFIVGFLISIIWSYNIKKVAFGTNADRVIYSFGAALGSVAGLLTSSFIVELLMNL